MNFKTFTTLILFLISTTVIFGQNREVNSNGNFKGVIKVKFDDAMVKQLQELHQQKNQSINKIEATTKNHVLVNNAELDNQNEQFRAYQYKRVFRYAGKFEARHKKFGLHKWYEISFNSKAAVKDLLEAYAKSAHVEIAEPLAKMNLVDNHPTPEKDGKTLTTTPNDPQYDNQWHYHNTGQTGGTADADIDLPEAWELETGSDQVVVAIQDQGVDPNHEDLDGNMWINTDEIPNNGVDDDNNGYVDDYHGYNFGDDQGPITAGDHGTHVGGTVAAETNNNSSVAGVAGGTGNNDGARLMSVEVFGSNGQSGFDEGFVYAADMGAHISQNSWGGGGESQSINDAIDYFIANGGTSPVMEGGVVVFAAGNDNVSSGAGTWPAQYASAIAVASTDHNDVKSSFSNYGSWVDIAAPGTDILSCKPGNSYQTMSGTSMACPHVSGVAALLVSYHAGNITPDEVRNRLTTYTDDISAQNSSYDGQLGSGRLNAYAAITGEAPTPPAATYCTSKGNDASYEWISSVAIGSYTNTSDGAGYTDFTNEEIQLVPGQSYDITLTPDFSGDSYNEYWKIWIDFNNDTTFDASELVYDAGSLSKNAVSGTINIPSDANGTRRMRVSMKYNGEQTACETFDYGEVEDYHVVFGTAPVEAPVAEFTADATTITEGETVNFTDQSSNEPTSWAWNFEGGTPSTSTAQNPSVTYNTPGTYQIELTATNDGGNDTETKTNYITVEEEVVPAPVADFTASATTISTGESVTFTDQSTNTPTAWSWSFEGGTPTSSTSQNPTVTYETAGTYQVELTASNDGGNDTETKTNYITVQEVTPEYCASNGQNVEYEWIAGVEIGNFTNNTDANGGYADFTDQTVNLAAGSSVNVTFTPGFASSSYSEYWVIWIDYNNDNDFDDPGEKVFTSNGSSTVSGSFNVDASASGTTRMRVTMKYNAAPSPCESFSYGEVEDYTVTFGDAVVEAPIADFSASTTTIDEGQSVSFTDLSTNEPTSWSWSFEGGTPSTSTAQNPSVTYNTAGTYQVSLTATNEGGEDTETKTGYITVNSGSVSYCASQGNNSSYEWIESISLGSFSNTSGDNGGYADLTGQTINLTPGATETITLTPGFSGSTYTEYWIVWIDYNKDGDFTDAGEQVVSGNGTGEITGDLNVDANATGTTRMRVTMKYNAAPTSCETFSYGEVEDYTVSFGSKEITSIADVDENTISIYPQPADETIHIDMENVSGTADVKLYNMNGQLVKTTQLNYDGEGFDFDVSSQSEGVYMLQILTDGAVNSKRIVIQ